MRAHDVSVTVELLTSSWSPSYRLLKRVIYFCLSNRGTAS